MSTSKKSTLVDAGLLVATFSRGDHHHATTVAFFAQHLFTSHRDCDTDQLFGIMTSAKGLRHINETYRLCAI